MYKDKKRKTIFIVTPELQIKKGNNVSALVVGIYFLFKLYNESLLHDFIVKWQSALAHETE